MKTKESSLSADRLRSPQNAAFIPRRAARSDLPATPFGGFTLIELLVVVTIIMILARLLMPAIGKSKANAYAAVCSNNLRQLGIAFKQYMMDWGCYPATCDDGGVGQGYANWILKSPVRSCSPMSTKKGTPDPVTKVTEYATGFGNYANPADKPCDETIYWCPMDHTAFDKWGTRASSYSMNAGLVNPSPNGAAKSSKTWGVKPEWVLHPASTYLMFEELTTEELPGYSSGGDGNFWCSNCDTTHRTGDQVTRRHNGGSNVLFCDGHVGWGKAGPKYLNDDPNTCLLVTITTINYDINHVRGCLPDPVSGKSGWGGPSEGDATIQQ